LQCDNNVTGYVTLARDDNQLPSRREIVKNDGLKLFTAGGGFGTANDGRARVVITRIGAHDIISNSAASTSGVSKPRADGVKPTGATGVSLSRRQINFRC
jgi:hypothetical protein